MIIFDSNFIEICSQGSNQHHSLTQNEQQSIISIYDGLIYRCRYTSFGLDELQDYAPPIYIGKYPIIYYLCLMESPALSMA